MFNWKAKTGLSETQWLQIIAAICAVAAHHSGYEQLAIHAGAISQAVLGGIGWAIQQRNKKKVKEMKDREDIQLYAIKKLQAELGIGSDSK